MEQLQARLRAHLPLHRPRPGGRPAHLRPDRGHVPRPDHGAVARRRPLRQPAAPVHDLAALGDPDPGSRGRAQRAPRSCSRATCRAPRTRRVRAASTPAAPTSSRRAARTTSRSCARSRATSSSATRRGDQGGRDPAARARGGVRARAPRHPPTSRRRLSSAASWASRIRRRAPCRSTILSISP